MQTYGSSIHPPSFSCLGKNAKQIFFSKTRQTGKHLEDWSSPHFYGDSSSVNAAVAAIRRLINMTFHKFAFMQISRWPTCREEEFVRLSLPQVAGVWRWRWRGRGLKASLSWMKNGCFLRVPICEHCVGALRSLRRSVLSERWSFWLDWCCWRSCCFWLESSGWWDLREALFWYPMPSKGLFEPSLCWDQVRSPTFPPEFGFLVLAETLNLMTFCYGIPLTFFCFLPYTTWILEVEISVHLQIYLKKPESIPKKFWS